MWGRSPGCIWSSATVNVGGSEAVWEQGKKREGGRENMKLHDKFIWGEQGVEEMLSFPPSLAPLFSCCHLSLSLSKINMYAQTSAPQFYCTRQQITCPRSSCWRVIKHKKNIIQEKSLLCSQKNKHQHIMCYSNRTPLVFTPFPLLFARGEPIFCEIRNDCCYFKETALKSRSVKCT